MDSKKKLSKDTLAHKIGSTRGNIGQQLFPFCCILFFLSKVLKTKESVLIELFKKEMIVKVKLMDNTCKYVYLMDVWNIYLKDAFSGCQILPCSHKVHRECAIAMIQNGV